MKKYPFLIAGIILVIVGIFLLISLRPAGTPAPEAVTAVPEVTVTPAYPTPKATAEPATPSPKAEIEDEPEPEPEPTPEPYVSPVDFEALWAKNPDVFGWLVIPNTDVSYPLLQREGDDDYYLTRDWLGNTAAEGCLYTQASYNSRGVSDPVTVIYGHRMETGDPLMFGRLQETYASAEALDTCGTIIIYLPEREITYNIFAAVPYDNRHIMYNYDFTDSKQAGDFFDSVFSVRALNSCIDQSRFSGKAENVIILSTCLKGERYKRFLVLAQEAAPENIEENETVKEEQS